MTCIYKGDDTGAFGQNFLTINLTGAEGLNISKAEFRCGDISKTFDSPQFPITVNFTAEETAKLQSSNSCSLAVSDESGLKKTCSGVFTFESVQRRV